MNQTSIHFCLVCSRVIPDSQLDPKLSDDPNICSCQSDSDSEVHPIPPSTPPSNPPPPISQDSAGKLPPSEQRDAALAVRRWAKTWMIEFGLVYPACVQEMRFQEPIVIYRHHKMDKEMADRKADARSAGVRNANSKKIAFAVSRDLLLFKNKAPRFFTFIPHSTDGNSLSRDEFWCMLSPAEKEEMIQEAHEDKLDVYCRKVESSTRRDHYQKCTRIIAGSLQALNHMMNFSQRIKHQRAIESFMAASRKRKRDKDVTRQMTHGLNFDEFDADDFN